MKLQIAHLMSPRNQSDMTCERVNKKSTLLNYEFEGCTFTISYFEFIVRAWYQASEKCMWTVFFCVLFMMRDVIINKYV